MALFFDWRPGTSNKVPNGKLNLTFGMQSSILSNCQPGIL